MIITILSTVFLCTFDNFLELFNIEGRYYFNHFFINLIITLSCFNDVILSYTEFDNIINLPINFYAIEYAYSIHFYHIIIYSHKFLFDDWLHHLLMIFLALPLGSTIKCGPIMGHSLFFLTGLPGGINYFLLFLTRNNLIKKQIQKYYNYILNLWIRQPGCIATSILSILFCIRNELNLFYKFGCIYIILSHYWNGIYFMEQVVRNYNVLYSSEMKL